MKLGPLCAAPSKPVFPDLYKPEDITWPSHAVTATKLESVAMSVMHLCILMLGSNTLKPPPSNAITISKGAGLVYAASER